MAMALELVVAIWLAALGLSVYFFVKSLNEALAKGRQPRTEKHAAKLRSFSTSPRHLLPVGHRGRRPAH